MSSKWPWPKDNRIDKLKRIIESYRAALQKVDPTACAVIDARMCEYGEAWVCGIDIVDVNALKTVDEIYADFGPGFEPWNIHKWSERNPEEVPKRGKRAGKTLYRVGDVIAYQVGLR